MKIRFRILFAFAVVCAALFTAWSRRQGIDPRPIEDTSTRNPETRTNSRPARSARAPLRERLPADDPPEISALAPADPFVDYLAVREETLRKWRETTVVMRSGTLSEILAHLESKFRLIARAEQAITADPERWLALRYAGGRGDAYLSILASVAGLLWMIDGEGIARLGTEDNLKVHEPPAYGEVLEFLRLNDWEEDGVEAVANFAAWKMLRERTVSGMSPSGGPQALADWLESRHEVCLKIDKSVSNLSPEPDLPAILAVENESAADFLDRILPPAGLSTTINRGDVLLLTRDAREKRDSAARETAEERARCERERDELLARSVRVWGTGVPLRVVIQRLAEGLGVTVRMAPEIWRSVATCDFRESAIRATDLLTSLSEKERLEVRWRFGKLWVLRPPE